MRKCLYCYQEIDAKHEGDYHPPCIKAFYGTTWAPALPYRLEEMEQLAKKAAELSITVPGVQPKLSLGWIKTTLENGHQGRLTIMDALEGHYILKPQNPQYPQMPENEHLSMKLAALFKIDAAKQSPGPYNNAPRPLRFQHPAKRVQQIKTSPGPSRENTAAALWGGKK